VISFAWSFSKGHPEYDFNSLLKEYRREVTRFVQGEREDYPPHVDHYFSPYASAIVDEYEQIVRACLRRGTAIPPFPEQQIEPHLDNTWLDTGEIDRQQLAGIGLPTDEHRPQDLFYRGG
jgi:homoserine O-succinyltransferase/O-acetyltransferase